MLNSLSPRSARILLVALLAATLIAISQLGLLDGLSLETLKLRQAELSAWTQGNPWLAAGAFFVVYVAATALSVPGAAVLTLAAGAIFGLLQGLLLVSFASSLGATLAMLIARFVLRDALTRRFAERLKTINAGVERDGAFYLLSLRLVPVFPFFMINLVAGLTQLRTWTFYWVSQLGMLPGTLAYVFAGTQLATIQTPSDVLSPALLAALTVLGLLPLIMRTLLRSLQARRVYKGHKRPRNFDYNLVVIGGGSAGLVSAYIGSAVKAKVALIEKHQMGGDCLNTGCVPSKALLRSARLLAEAGKSQRYGIASMKAEFSFADVMTRVRQVISKIEPHDSVERYSGLGVDVIKGEARIVSPWEIEVNGQRLSTRSMIVASGAMPLVPNIPGLDQIDYLTSDTVWSLQERPERLVVLGGGPIGSELAQAFARFGSQVSVVEMAPRLLPREDQDAAQALTQMLSEEGVTVASGHTAKRVEMTDQGPVLVCVHDDNEIRIEFDRMLIALGRKARTEGFGLESLAVTLRDNGTIAADELLRTNYPNIYVAGDVTGPYQFTHVAAHQAWYASVNALLAPLWRFKVNYRVIPWVTFTDPEIARVGLNEQEAAERGIAVEVTKYGLDDLDRAIADSADYGHVKVLTPPGKDRILGVQIVGAHSGELLAEFVLAMTHGIGLNKLLGTIHVYPTMSEASKYTAGQWKRAHAPALALKLAQRYFNWRRGDSGDATARPEAS